MKKLLLSSIIMLGVCGIASAQTDSKVAQKHLGTTTTSAAPVSTPQKAAIMPASDVAVTTAAAASDKEAATTTSAAAPKPARVNKTTVNAAGVVVPSDDVKREEKMAKVNAANAAPTGRPAKQQN